MKRSTTRFYDLKMMVRTFVTWKRRIIMNRFLVHMAKLKNKKLQNLAIGMWLIEALKIKEIVKKEANLHYFLKKKKIHKGLAALKSFSRNKTVNRELKLIGDTHVKKKAIKSLKLYHYGYKHSLDMSNFCTNIYISKTKHNGLLRLLHFSEKEKGRKKKVHTALQHYKRGMQAKVLRHWRKEVLITAVSSEFQALSKWRKVGKIFQNWREHCLKTKLEDLKVLHSLAFYKNVTAKNLAYDLFETWKINAKVCAWF